MLTSFSTGPGPGNAHQSDTCPVNLAFLKKMQSVFVIYSLGVKKNDELTRPASAPKEKLYYEPESMPSWSASYVAMA